MSKAHDYVIGIDTGGTYTDAVLLEHRSRKVIDFSKTLTTRDDLTRGIVRALEDLDIKDAGSVKLVGVSSTLATNSIAEGKERSAGLILIGYDQSLIDTYNLTVKFPTSRWVHVNGGHDTQGLEKEPLDRVAIRQWLKLNIDQFEAIAISAYFSPLNPMHEEQALEVVRQTCSLPVVLGHHLSAQLDSIKRATTACLNASLVAVMQEFITAVRQALDCRGIQAPLMIVKGDGSLISDTEAVTRPVETVLSGPAASAIGGRFLSGQGNALVIDVGGTTTDLALIDGFEVTVSEEGALVGKFETAVKAARIRTAGLGGDSRISVDPDGAVQAGPQRVVPLARLAAEAPKIKKEIAGLKKKREFDRRASDIEYWYLTGNNHVSASAEENSRQQNLLKLLQEGPQSLAGILKQMNVYHPLQLNADALIRRGVIEQAALTPTDLLHYTGQMDTWCAESSRHVIEYIGKLFGLDPDSFARETIDLVIAGMVEEAITFLGCRTTENRLPGRIEDPWGRWLINEAIKGTSPYLAVTLQSRMPVIGIGAPAEILIKPIAELLQTQFILPDHAPVANAVGAVAGSVIVEKEAIVYARDNPGAVAYLVQIEGENAVFVEEAEANDYAEQTVMKLARDGAVCAGVIEPLVTIEKRIDGHLQRYAARSIGNPRL